MRNALGDTFWCHRVGRLSCEVQVIDKTRVIIRSEGPTSSFRSVKQYVMYDISVMCCIC
jgi:hypothetical protein